MTDMDAPKAADTEAPDPTMHKYDELMAGLKEDGQDEDGKSSPPAADSAEMAAMMSMLGGKGGGKGDAPGGGMDMEAMMSMMGGGKGGGKGDAPGGGMDMEAMMSMLGGKGGGGMGGAKGGGKGGGKGEKDDSEKEGEAGKWHWQQKGEEVQIRFPTDPPVTKKDVSVKFKRATLQVSIRGEALMDSALGGTVEVDECTWCIAPGGTELQVMLTKQKEDEEWRSLLA